MNISFVLVKIWPSVWIHPLNLNVGKILSRLNVACLGTSCDVTSRDDCNL